MVKNANSRKLVDVHVGSMIRARRNWIGITQKQLAEALSLTIQQVQKYEQGANRIGASRLKAIADRLGVPVTHFFEGAPVVYRFGQSGAIGEDEEKLIRFIASSEGLRLNRAFRDVVGKRTKRAFVELVKALSEDEECDKLADGSDRLSTK